MNVNLLQSASPAVLVAAANLLASALGMSVPINLGLSITASAGALTIAAKGADGSDPSATNPVLIPFPSSTLTTGTPVLRSLTAAQSLVITSGSTMGVPANNVGFRLWIVEFDDGGTLRLGAINCSTYASGVATIYPISQVYDVAGSTAEGGAGGADSAGLFYTGTAVSSKTFRVIGLATWESGLTSIGTWTAPTSYRLWSPEISLPGQPTGNVKTCNSSGSTLSASTTFTDVTGASVQIVPRSAANLVEIHFRARTQASNGGAGVNSEANIRLMSASNQLQVSTTGVISGSGTNMFTDGAVPFMFLEGPNTTSGQTYKLQHACLNTSHNVTTDSVWGMAREIIG